MFYSMQQQQTISQSDCDIQWKVGFIGQLATTSSVVEMRSSSKAFSKAKLAPKKGHGHCLVIHYSFLKLGETIESEKYAQQIDVKHWKLQRLQPVLVNRMGPVLHNTQPHVAKHFKCWTNWATKFCFICHILLTSCQPITTSSSISTTLCRENAFTTSKRQKRLFRVL